MALLLAPLPAHATDESRQGTVQMSDGEVIEGRIRLTEGNDIRILDATLMRSIPLGELMEIRFIPRKEELVRQWRFAEAGQTRKEYFGEPYPIRYLAAVLSSRDGLNITGHLYTAAMYIEADGKTRKIVLPAKLRGKEGESLESLVYPARISLDGEHFSTNAAVCLKLAGISPASGLQIAALTRPALARLEGHAESHGEFDLPSPLGQDVFLASRAGNRIAVGWPQEQDAALFETVSNALVLAKDFFDEKVLLGVFGDTNQTDDIYSLVLLSRKGPTSLDAERSQPWQVAVLRWKYDAPARRLTLCGRGYFFRDIVAKVGPMPVVELTDRLWHVNRNGNVWTAGGKE